MSQGLLSQDVGVLAKLVSYGGERPPIAAVEEFLIHGVKYAFPAQRGEATPRRRVPGGIPSSASSDECSLTAI
jgi:hypothetical protein